MEAYISRIGGVSGAGTQLDWARDNAERGVRPPLRLRVCYGRQAASSVGSLLTMEQDSAME